MHLTLIKITQIHLFKFYKFFTQLIVMNVLMKIKSLLILNISNLEIQNKFLLVIYIVFSFKNLQFIHSNNSMFLCIHTQ